MFRGKLFAGALFAGALFSSADSPVVEESSGGRLPIRYEQRQRVFDAVEFGKATLTIKSGRVRINELSVSSVGKASLTTRSGTVDSKIFRSGEFDSVVNSIATGTVTDALRLSDSVSGVRASVTPNNIDSRILIRASTFDGVTRHFATGNVHTNERKNEIIGTAKVTISTGEISETFVKKPIPIIPVEPIPHVTLTVRDYRKAEQFAKRIDRNLVRLMNG